MLFRPSKWPSQISTTTPSKNAIKYIAKKGPFLEASGCVAPDGEYTQYQWKQATTNWRSPQCDSGSAIWPLTPPTRSDLRTSQHRRQRGPQTRIFSPQLILVCRRPRCCRRPTRRCRKREKWQGMRPPILTIHRTETTRRSDFAVDLIRRDRRAPVMMMLVHEECRITCDHRHSLWYLTGSLDCGLSRNAIRQWLVHERLCADGRGIQNRGKRNPERRVPNATFDNLLSHG
jgi:hypothetical protein